ncbi:MAG: DEAD/DEAH box helicase [Leptothrix sp. (in: b-proteobacteria)]
MSFATLGLAPALVRAAEALGHRQPTPIQAQAIPVVLRGADLLGAAQTGSGKTLAFALPLLQGLLITRRPWPRRFQALVLVPTRELAVQVGEVITELAQQLAVPADRPKVVVAHGGVSINPQLMALRGGAEVLVATPGRLLDLVEHNALRFDGLAMLVLDEADRLLDLGFADELARIRAVIAERAAPAGLGRRLQQLLFSATFPETVQALVEATLHQPIRIDVREALDADVTAAEGGYTTALAITQRAIEVDVGRRTGLLKHLLAEPGWDQVLVFVASRYATELVAHKLERDGIRAAALHGELSQGRRGEVLGALRKREIQVLISTDIAARGIDIVGLPVVVNYDLPRSADDHVHRIGRTGRAGAAGLAVSFVSAGTEGHFRLIEKRQGQRVARERIAGFEPLEVASADQAAGGVKGNRPSKKDKLRAAAAAAQDKALRR